jgi:hypothetical protein
MKKLLALLLITFVVSAPLSAQKRSGSAAAPSKFGNTDGVTAAQLKEHLTFIASDELEGRDTPSRGLDIAAMYIAQHLKSWGIRPAGDSGTYFQKFPLRRARIDVENTRVNINGQSFAYGTDFLTSLIASNVSGSGIVFAGNGWVVKSKNINPYQGIDVKDKIVVVVNSLPKGVTFNDLKGPVGGDWMSPPYYAQMNGAKAVINFPTFGNLVNWDSTRWNQADKGGVEFGKHEASIKIPAITLSPRAVASLFQGEKFSATNLFKKAAAAYELESFDLKPT